MRLHLVRRRCTGGLLAALLLAPLTLLSGCGSSEPKYYTLTTSPGTPKVGGPRSVEVQTPVIADYLKRDDIVLGNNGNQLHLAKHAAWAEPLSGAIGRNLALDLAQRLPGSSVYAQNSGISATADANVDVNISRFARDEAGRAEITATTAVHRSNVAVHDIKPVHVVAPLKDDDTATMAAALSQLLGKVADNLAEQLRAMPRK